MLKFSPRIYQPQGPATSEGLDGGEEDRIPQLAALGFDHLMVRDDGTHVAGLVSMASSAGLRLLLEMSLDQPDPGDE
ncbi:MAG: hypothetical protein JWQ72_1711, partial [Polaromonas sp.]|nr:hypothetical protein [Polaromonas sp.]